MSRELFRDYILYLPSKVVPALVGILSIPILSRLLSPEQYGQYALIINTVAIVSALTLAWLVSSALRFYFRYRQDGLLRFLAKMWLISAIVGLLVYILVHSVVFHGEEITPLFWGGVTLFIAIAGYEFLLGITRAGGRAAWFSFFTIWRSIVGFGLGLLFLLYLGLGVSGLLLGAAIAMLLMLLPMARIVGGWSVGAGENKESLFRGEILRYGMPAAGISAATVCLSYADRYILEYLHGTAAVGLYAANYDIAEKTIFFLNSTFLLSSSVIGFRKFEQEGEKSARIFLGDLMRFYLILAVPLALLLATFSNSIVGLALPQGYHDGWVVIPFVAVGAVCIGVAHRYTLLLSFYKRTGLILWCTLGALAGNLVLNFILVPRYNYLGAAMATAISYALLLFLAFFFSRRYFHPPFPYTTALRVGAAGLTSVVFSYGFQQLFPDMSIALVFTGLLFGGLVFGIVLIMLGELREDERDWFRTRMAKFGKGK